MKVSIVIPTVTGREEYLARCMRLYGWRTDAAVEHIVIKDRLTCGIAWQEGAEQATGDYLHLTADDIVPGVDWLEPCLEAVHQREVPVGLVVTPTPDMMDEDDEPPRSNPLRPGHSNFFERPGGPDEIPDWYEAQGESEYPSVPFCSMEQWRQIGPMIASHYGTDKWFGRRAKQAGIACCVRHGVVFYHYVAGPGRVPARVPTQRPWTHRDRLDFDLNIAYPAYCSGELAPHETHPLSGTDEGRALARAWREEHVR